MLSAGVSMSMQAGEHGRGPAARHAQQAPGDARREASSSTQRARRRDVPRRPPGRAVRRGRQERCPGTRRRPRPGARPRCGSTRARRPDSRRNRLRPRTGVRRRPEWPPRFGPRCGSRDRSPHCNDRSASLVLARRRCPDPAARDRAGPTGARAIRSRVGRRRVLPRRRLAPVSPACPRVPGSSARDYPGFELKINIVCRTCCIFPRGSRRRTDLGIPFESEPLRPFCPFSVDLRTERCHGERERE